LIRTRAGLGGRSRRFEPEPRDPARALVFTHFPKTSGTAIVHGLTAALGARRALSGFDASQFVGEDDFAGMAQERRAAIFLDPQSLPRDADLVAGHFAASTTLAAYPQAQSVTVLREPRVRTLSHFFFWRSLGDEALEGWGRPGERVRSARDALGAFLRNERLAGQIDNLYVRMLLWPDPRLPPRGWIDPSDDEALVTEAMDRLVDYDFVDVVENPRMLAAFSDWIGGALAYSPANVTAFLPPALRFDLSAALTLETAALLAERNRLDIRLWRAVAEARMGSPSASLECSALTGALDRYARLMSG